MKPFRITLSVIAAGFSALMLIAAMTVPAFAATGPAILAIAAGVLAWFLWPRKPKAKANA